MNIRLSISNSETACRTRDLYSPVKSISLSSSVKDKLSQALQNRTASQSIALEERALAFKARDKKCQTK